MLDRKTGIIVKSDESTALLFAMQEFVITPGLCPQMSRRAREYMENRSFENAFILPGRSIGYPMPPPQIRTCRTPAYGSSASALFTELKIKRVSPFGA
jgi:hypothetical protein